MRARRRRNELQKFELDLADGVSAAPFVEQKLAPSGDFECYGDVAPTMRRYLSDKPVSGQVAVVDNSLTDQISSEQCSRPLFLND
jgi:hypothetical protein